MRDRLIELLEKAFEFHIDDPYCIPDAGEFADHLLANGVIVPPCKVGDTVYKVWSVGKYGKSVADFVVTNISQIAKDVWVVKYQKQSKSIYSKPTRYQCNFYDFGKTVFLTKGEARRALKESENNADR